MQRHADGAVDQDAWHGWARFATSRQDRTTEDPVVLITGMGDAQREGEALEAGAVAFIHKPIDRTLFTQIVGAALEMSCLPDRVLSVQQKIADVTAVSRALNRRINQTVPL